MTEQEQHLTQQDTKLAPNPIVAAIPALAGGVLVVLHLRQPLVHTENQPVLMSSCLGLLCISLALWLFWGLEKVVQRVTARFDDRHDLLEDLARQQLDTIMAAVIRVQQKTARLCKQVNNAEERLTGTEHELRDAVTRLDAIAEILTGLSEHLAVIQQQQIALGRAFIDNGEPDRSRLN